MTREPLFAWLPAPRLEAIKASVRRLRYRAINLALSYSPPELEAALRRLGVGDGDAIMMHASFSSLNGFTGEPQTVIDCLLDIIGPHGHLFMMSMPYTASAREYLDQGKSFDVRRTPSLMGLVSESFRRRKGVLRSANPLHPVLAWGPRAEWVVAGHEDLEHSCGRGSPFEKLLELESKALLFDVELSVLTFSHYLEDAFADTAPVNVYTEEPADAAIIDRTGVRRTVKVYPYTPEAGRQRNFSVLYDALLKGRRVIRGRIGNTRLQLVALRDVLKTGNELLARGTHLYGLPGQPVRILPTSRGPLREFLSTAAHEITSGQTQVDAAQVASHLFAPVSRAYRAIRMSSEARRELARDRAGLPEHDPGIEQAVAAAAQWLGVAQDRSASHDGGVARHYSLLDGWSTSYPETTGYIIPTMLEYARRSGDESCRHRARRMLDWLVDIQLPDGGFQGGLIDSRPVRTVTFNSGQILLGLAAGATQLGDARYLQAMHRAAAWLSRTQDDDGCWRAYPSPFTAAGEKTYDTHVAWALFEAARVAPGSGYEEAAIRNVRWALTHQRANGWLGRCCLGEPTQPLTHTIGYALRGVVEAYRFTGDDTFLQSACRIADALAGAIDSNGFLPGRLRADWSAAVSWSCLTGASQIAICWMMLDGCPGSARYLDAARLANRYVRRSMRLDGSDGLRGGVKGSFPVDGDYGSFETLSWAAKFSIDANFMELDRNVGERPTPHTESPA